MTAANSVIADPARRPVRSFVLRQGRMSAAQQRALDTLLPRLGIAYAPECVDFAAIFGRIAPVILEIGFGMGETTAAPSPRPTLSTISWDSKSMVPAWARC